MGAGMQLEPAVLRELADGGSEVSGEEYLRVEEGDGGDAGAVLPP